MSNNIRRWSPRVAHDSSQLPSPDRTLGLSGSLGCAAFSDNSSTRPLDPIATAIWEWTKCPHLRRSAPVLKGGLLAASGFGAAGVCNSFQVPANRNLSQSDCGCVGLASAEFLGVVPDQSGGNVTQ